MPVQQPKEVPHVFPIVRERDRRSSVESGIVATTRSSEHLLENVRAAREHRLVALEAVNRPLRGGFATRYPRARSCEDNDVAVIKPNVVVQNNFRYLVPVFAFTGRMLAHVAV